MIAKILLIPIFSCSFFVGVTQPKVLWKFRTSGRVYSSPAVDHDILFIGSGDQHLYAVNRNTGRKIWSFKTGGAVHSSPAVDNGLVFFNSHDGFIYAVDKNTGKLAWKYQTGGEKTYDLWDYYLSSPIIHDGVVFIGSGDNHVYALDSRTGRLIWKFKTEGVVHASPVISDSLLYIGSFDGNLYALQLRDGQLRWKFKTIGETYFPKGEIQKDALVHEGMVYVGSRDYNIYALDTKTGTLVWSRKEEGSWVIATPLAIEEYLYYGTSDSEAFYCIDSKDGAIKWKKSVNMRVFGQAVAHDNSIIFGCFNGKLYAVDPADGSTLWEFQTSGSKANYLTVYDESGSFKKGFEKYGNDIEGSEEKILSLGSILSTPLIVNETVYFGSADGYVYALDM